MARDTLDIDAEEYPVSLPEYVGSYMFEILFYGVYTVLTFLCIYLLWGDKRTSRRVLLAATMAMFATTTADTGMTVHHAFRYVLQGQVLPAYHTYSKYLFYITNNLIADSLILYRCYVVWRYQKIIIIFPSIVLLFTTICGYLFVILGIRNLDDLLPVYLWLLFSLNMLLTLLTASKIFWNARQARSIFGSETTGRYDLFAIIIESGAIYSIYILLDLVIPTILFDSALIQSVGIISMLIIMRVGLVRDAGSIVTLQGAEMRQSSTPSIFSTVGTGPATELPTACDDTLSISSCV